MKVSVIITFTTKDASLYHKAKVDNRWSLYGRLTCAQEAGSVQKKDAQPGRAAEEKIPTQTTAALPGHSGPVKISTEQVVKIFYAEN